jgi:hypothetical protein
LPGRHFPPVAFLDHRAAGSTAVSASGHFSGLESEVRLPDLAHSRNAPGVRFDGECLGLSGSPSAPYDLGGVLICGQSYRKVTMRC